MMYCMPLSYFGCGTQDAAMTNNPDLFGPGCRSTEHKDALNFTAASIIVHIYSGARQDGIIQLTKCCPLIQNAKMHL